MSSSAGISCCEPDSSQSEEAATTVSKTLRLELTDMRTTPSKTTPGLDEVMILMSTLLWGSLTALLSLVLL
ncbi:unnamed protein product [Arctogadus glacialis]